MIVCLSTSIFQYTCNICEFTQKQSSTIAKNTQHLLLRLAQNTFGNGCDLESCDGSHILISLHRCYNNIVALLDKSHLDGVADSTDGALGHGNAIQTDNGVDTTVKHELLCDLPVWAERNDGDSRSVCRNESRKSTSGRQNENCLGTSLLSSRYCRLGQSYLSMVVCCLPLSNMGNDQIVSPILELFGRLDDIGHHLHSVDRVPSLGSFSTQHHCICSVINRISHISNLSPCRTRVLRHRFQHLSSHNNWLSGGIARGYHLLLGIGYGLDGNLHTKITSCNHDAIAFLQNLVKILHSCGTLNFGDDEWERLRRMPSQFAGTALHVLANIAHAIGILNEGGGDKVHILRHAVLDIKLVLFRHGGKVRLGTREVDARPTSELAGVIDSAGDRAMVVLVRFDCCSC
mmetsp:Transcript_15818/g.45572  ORF Transcript_15818/g.45572 Transcript_15818/m.45572 type:complete len:403 (-) Transcript_15818:712-1920(-)